MEKYEIIKRIGCGANGMVWKASDKETGEVVAIKRQNCKNMREAKALRKMNHPNIINLKESFIEDDIMYLALEHMECNLYERMINTSEKPFSEDDIRNLCFQLFQGLAYMHNNGYFHRDLKPENLLVTNNVIKISDLGEARETNGKPPFTDYITTRWYRAPEVLLGARMYDSTVDMWAMGAIMAELFTHQPLFPGSSAGDQIYKICSVIGSPTEFSWNVGIHLADSINYQFPQLPGVRLSAVLPSASPEAVNLIDTLLSWSPCMRPTAMEALEHPFFYSCYDVPPTLNLLSVFEMGRKPESLKEKTSPCMKSLTSSKSCTIDSEIVDLRTQDLISLLPEDPFDLTTGSKSCSIESDLVDPTLDLISLLPDNPFDF